MLSYPHIDPVMLDLPGPFDLRWYGLMYVLGFAAAYALGRYRARQPQWDWTPRQVEDLVVWGAFGVILGGRLGSALFYQPGHYLSQPLDLLRIWEGGMSFHGGLIGVLVACWLLGRRQGRGFFAVADFIAPLVPLGLAFGRIGNFINGELWGRPTDLPWGMVFPGAGPLPRHPSQLYESLLEGFVLFALLWFHGKLAAGQYLRHAHGWREPPVWGEQPQPVLGARVMVTPNTSPANASYSLAVLIQWFDRVAALRRALASPPR